MTTPDETKVPPGWVRLTLADGSERGKMIFPAKAVKDSWLAGTAGVQQEDEEAFILDQPVAETWAEVAALIAEAEAAERRARALPVMAAQTWSDDG